MHIISTKGSQYNSRACPIMPLSAVQVKHQNSRLGTFQHNKTFMCIHACCSDQAQRAAPVSLVRRMWPSDALLYHKKIIHSPHHLVGTPYGALTKQGESVPYRVHEVALQRQTMHQVALQQQTIVGIPQYYHAC